jgi:hypothetical protein
MLVAMSEMVTAATFFWLHDAEVSIGSSRATSSSWYSRTPELFPAPGINLAIE